MQKAILTNANAVTAVRIIQEEHNNQDSRHLEMLTFEYGSALVTNIPSAPLFAVRAADYALSLRARLQLPARMAPFWDTPAHRLLSQTTVATKVHNAIRDSILTTAALAEHAVKLEPRNAYGCKGDEGVDGIVEREHAAGGLMVSAEHGRIAFDVFTTSQPAAIVPRENAKHKRYGSGVAAAGDTFFAPAFTSMGAPLPSARAFFRAIAHSGDSVADSEGRDAPRFDAEAATWATPNHEAFMVHAAAAAAARAIGNAVRAYAKVRIMRQYMVRALTERAPLVPRPDLSG